MANRDPQTPPRDHTVAIIGGVVALVALLVVLAIGLEWTDSPNTMAILGILGTGLAIGAVGQILNLNKTNQGVQIAARAEETAKDTNVRTQNIEHALNGNFEPRVTEIVGKVLDEKFAAFEETLDARIRAGITAVNANPEREKYFDDRMTKLVEAALEKREAMCKVPPARRTRR